MAYLSLYRKWRPQRFSDVVGQEHVVRTLKNALDSGRTAHAYIFSGPRGTGKTTLARLLAKGLNCQEGPTGEWCNECDNCVRIAKGQSVDVIEIDGASNRGIDEIRDVREKVKFAPAQGRYKVYIIDEVHMLTTEAFNALLKVLEEPPGHVVFVFATTESHKIPATILSRCQKFDFRAFTAQEIADQVKQVAESEGAKVDRGALRLIAAHSAGGMRDALGFLDQCIAFTEGVVTEALAAQVLGVVERERLERLARAVADRNLADCLRLVKEIADAGRDLRQFATDAVQYFRDLMLLAAAPDAGGLVTATEEELQEARSLAGRFSVRELLGIVEALGRAESDMRWASTAQLPIEMALIEVVQQTGALSPVAASSAGGAIEAIIERIERLEAALERAASESFDRRVAGFQAGPAETSAEKPLDRALDKPLDKPFEKPVEKSVKAAANRDEEHSHEKVTSPRPPLASGSAASPPSKSGAAAAHPLLAMAQESWPRVLEFLRSSKHVQEEAFLREGRPGAVEGENTIVVYFSPSHRFHQANIEREKNRVVVEKAMTKVLGKEVRVKAVLGEPPSPPPGRSTDPPSERASMADSAVVDPSPDEPSPSDAGPREVRGADRPLRVLEEEPFPATQTIDPDEIDEPILKAALKLFGGTITRIERKEAQPQ